MSQQIAPSQTPGLPPPPPRASQPAVAPLQPQALYQQPYYPQQAVQPQYPRHQMSLIEGYVWLFVASVVTAIIAFVTWYMMDKLRWDWAYLMVIGLVVLPLLLRTISREISNRRLKKERDWEFQARLFFQNRAQMYEISPELGRQALEYHEGCANTLKNMYNP